ncbi:hypothetical protein DYU05_07935 [Mucilaginibacter terrenus]|uniref:Uncharacterized protein n=1 Tax=Mucilaginibacter terrenus TaxID=2482727 RepID=A0A3E2NWW6_9SPHI|nr:hypothetical protein [Mucilaginibacter terrenus]RFZ85516.1 hypothetical protein DYU05_07935 [Mucilaginibacter terrenus]
MSSFLFDTTGLSEDTVTNFQNTYEELCAAFNMHLTGHINFHLEDFEAFNQYHSYNVLGSYVIKNGKSDCYILFIDTHTKKAHQNHITDHYEYQTWALAYLKHDFGRVKIRPETLVDKIGELIHPLELDFKEDKVFSDTFYVLVNDREKAISCMDRHFRNAVMDIRDDDFVIEIVNHTLVIGNKKPITPDRAIYMAEFVSKLSSLC